MQALEEILLLVSSFIDHQASQNQSLGITFYLVIYHRLSVASKIVDILPLVHTKLFGQPQLDS